MADLLGELESSPEMQKQLEELVKGLGEAAAAGAAGSEAGPMHEAIASAAQAPTAGKERAGSAAKAAEDSFQEQIRKTMERMQHSSSTADSAAASSADDPLAQLLKEMEAGNFPGAGGGGDEDFSKMLLGMMEQLTNKEILYEPMKELHDKFPEWLEKNRDKTDKGDLERYEEQQRLVKEIVGKFEEKGYSDDNAAHREYIVERMQKVSSLLKHGFVATSHVVSDASCWLSAAGSGRWYECCAGSARRARFRVPNTMSFNCTVPYCAACERCDVRLLLRRAVIL